MGDFMMQDDIYIKSLLEMMNIRFAPAQVFEGRSYGGIAEMAAIQREFGIFKDGRAFAESVSALGVYHRGHVLMQHNWHRLLTNLATKESNRTGATGDAAIVHTIIEDLQRAKPEPIYFVAHDLREPGRDRVLIEPDARPLFYLDQTYILISIPMRPKSTPR